MTDSAPNAVPTEIQQMAQKMLADQASFMTNFQAEINKHRNQLDAFMGNSSQPQLDPRISSLATFLSTRPYLIDKVMAFTQLTENQVQDAIKGVLGPSQPTS